MSCFSISLNHLYCSSLPYIQLPSIHLPPLHLPPLHLPTFHLPPLYLPPIHLSPLHLPPLHLPPFHLPPLHLLSHHLHSLNLSSPPSSHIHVSPHLSPPILSTSSPYLYNIHTASLCVPNHNLPSLHISHPIYITMIFIFSLYLPSVSNSATSIHQVFSPTSCVHSSLYHFTSQSYFLPTTYIYNFPYNLDCFSSTNMPPSLPVSLLPPSVLPHSGLLSILPPLSTLPHPVHHRYLCLPLHHPFIYSPSSHLLSVIPYILSPSCYATPLPLIKPLSLTEFVCFRVSARVRCGWLTLTTAPTCCRPCVRRPITPTTNYRCCLPPRPPQTSPCCPGQCPSFSNLNFGDTAEWDVSS